MPRTRRVTTWTAIAAAVVVCALLAWFAAGRPWPGRAEHAGPGGESGTSTGQDTPGGQSGTVFAPDSFWYQEIPADAQPAAESADFARTLVRGVSEHGAAVNVDHYTPAVYTVDAATPRVRVAYAPCQGEWGDRSRIETEWAAQFDQVPVPADAVASKGTDGEIVIHSPATGELWEMWRFERTANGLTACWGGKLSDTTHTDGVYPFPFGVAASGLSLLGGTVTADELRSGQIDHVLAISVRDPRADVVSWPANRTDGTSHDPASIPEGTRLRLDPSADVDALHLSPAARAIALAAQRYGFIVRDQTSTGAVLYAENNAPMLAAGQPDPYADLGGVPPERWLDGFPWDRVQAMPQDYGRP